MTPTRPPDLSGSFPSPWLTPEQAAARLQVRVRTIYAMIRAGKLLAKRVGVSGRIYRIPARALDHLDETSGTAA